MNLLHHNIKGVGLVDPLLVPPRVLDEVKKILNEPARPSTDAVVLDDFAQAVGSPQAWAKIKAQELQSHPSMTDLGMSLEECTYWLQDLARKWRKRARKTRMETSNV